METLFFSGVFDLPWWLIVLVALTLTHMTIVSVTIFLHRHQAHHVLDLHPAVRHLFRFWLWLTTGMVTKEWAAVYRKHHAKCDMPEDPHSPLVYGLNRVLWRGVYLYVHEARKPQPLERYGHVTLNDWLDSAKLSSKWYEFDIGWLYIRALEVLGLAKVKHVAPVPSFSSPKAVLDPQTLQAVIACR
jgi:fatty-acid desaturase